jgi:transposase
MHRHELSDEQWERLQPLLPPIKPWSGRPNLDHRQILNALLWLAKTGAPWRDLPERYGKWQTVYSRFRRWQRAGLWDRILQALQTEADARGELDWSRHFVDGTVVRAHQHAAGARKKGARKPSAAVKAGSAPRSTSAPSGAASRSSLH